jgi:hypothetical protein
MNVDLQVLHVKGKIMKLHVFWIHSIQQNAIPATIPIFLFIYSELGTIGKSFSCLVVDCNNVNWYKILRIFRYPISYLFSLNCLLVRLHIFFHKIPVDMKLESCSKTTSTLVNVREWKDPCIYPRSTFSHNIYYFKI